MFAIELFPRQIFILSSSSITSLGLIGQDVFRVPLALFETVLLFKSIIRFDIFHVRSKLCRLRMKLINGFLFSIWA